MCSVKEINKGKLIFLLKSRALAMFGCLVLLYLNWLDCRAQSSLSHWSKHFPKIDSSISIPFQVVPPLDTMSQEGLIWKLNFSANEPPVFIFLSISGALLCFRDSLLRMPIPVEKNRKFYFTKWRLGEKYKLSVWRCTGPHSFLKMAWTNLNSGEVLDEIFLCYPFSFRCISNTERVTGKGVNLIFMP